MATFKSHTNLTNLLGKILSLNLGDMVSDVFKLFSGAINILRKKIFSLNFGEMVPDVFKLFCPSEPDFTPPAQKNWPNQGGENH